MSSPGWRICQLLCPLSIRHFRPVFKAGRAAEPHLLPIPLPDQLRRGFLSCHRIAHHRAFCVCQFNRCRRHSLRRLLAASDENCTCGNQRSNSANRRHSLTSVMLNVLKVVNADIPIIQTVRFNLHRSFRPECDPRTHVPRFGNSPIWWPGADHCTVAIIRPAAGRSSDAPANSLAVPLPAPAEGAVHGRPALR